MKQAFLFLLALGIFAGLGPAAAAVATSEAQAGNVTSSQFDFFWQVDGESVPGLDIFSDAAGTESLNGQLGVEFFPLEADEITVGQTAAQRTARRELQQITQGKGIRLARVTGAQPGTTYHLRQRSYASDGTTPNEAGTASLIAVTTAQATAFVVEAQQLRVMTGGCFAGSQGLVMKLSKADSRYPLFAVVGDHGLQDEALFDLTRLLNTGGNTNETLAGTVSFDLQLIGPGTPPGVTQVEVPYTGDFTVAKVTETTFSAGFPGLAYFSIEPINTPRIGLPFAFTVTARNAQGGVLTAYDGTVELAAGEPEDLTSGAGITAAFVNGVLTGHQVVPAVLGPITLTVTRPCGIETGSRNINVVPPSVGLDISFSAPVYSVNQTATSVTLTLTRSETQPVSVILNTSDGVAQTQNPPFAAAVAPTDYEDLTGDSTLIQFMANELVKEVSVTLVPKTPLTTPNRRFTATLSPTVDGAVLDGAITTASIHILATDTKAPTLTVTTPSSSTKTLSTPHPYTVTGKAGDARGVDRVEVKLNGVLVPSVLGAAPKSTSVPFSAIIHPVEGQNELEVAAYDMSNLKSSVVIRRFTFTRRYVLTLARQVPTVFSTTPDKAGTVALTATPKAAATKLTKGPAPQTAAILPGTAVKVTASVKSGHLFSHWQGLPAGAQVAGNVLSFNMPAADVPDVAAVFVTNPLPALVGSKSVNFQGLALPETGTAASNSTVGLLTSTLTPSKGALSGKVLMDGKSTSFSALIHGNNSVWFKVGKVYAPTFAFLDRELSASWSADGLAFTVNGTGDAVTSGLARRAVPAPAGLLDVKGKSGYYTLALPTMTQTPEKPASEYPQGAGYGTFTLSSNGALKLSGLLADGSKITSSTFLIAADRGEFFVRLPIPGASSSVLGGSFLGTLVFDRTQATSDVTGLNLRWFRPAATREITGTKASALATQLYTPGWPSGISVDGVGTLYDGAVSVQTTLGLGNPGTTDGNARLLFRAGTLGDEVEVTKFNISANKITKLLASDKSFTLSVTPKTGLFKGTFTPDWTDRKALPAFQGVLLQKEGRRVGHGHFRSNRTGAGTLDPEAGDVTLSAPPP